MNKLYQNKNETSIEKERIIKTDKKIIITKKIFKSINTNSYLLNSHKNYYKKKNRKNVKLNAFSSINNNHNLKHNINTFNNHRKVNYVSIN